MILVFIHILFIHILHSNAVKCCKKKISSLFVHLTFGCYITFIKHCLKNKFG